jgi:hypothetical protein
VLKEQDLAQLEKHVNNSYKMARPRYPNGYQHKEGELQWGSVPKELDSETITKLWGRPPVEADEPLSKYKPPPVMRPSGPMPKDVNVEEAFPHLTKKQISVETLQEKATKWAKEQNIGDKTMFYLGGLRDPAESRRKQSVHEPMDYGLDDGGMTGITIKQEEEELPPWRRNQPAAEQYGHGQDAGGMTRSTAGRDEELPPWRRPRDDGPAGYRGQGYRRGTRGRGGYRRHDDYQGSRRFNRSPPPFRPRSRSPERDRRVEALQYSGRAVIKYEDSDDEMAGTSGPGTQGRNEDF